MAGGFNFPAFSDGNVHIRLSQNDDVGFIVHSSILALHSSWFESSLSERWTGAPEGDFINGAKHHYKYELRFENGSSLGMLVSAGSNTDTELEE